MTLGIMQPYFFPYIGYFQLLNAVDKFVVYDDVHFIKQGWINRNNILGHHGPNRLTIPLIAASSNKLINKVEIDQGKPWSKKLAKTLEQTYGKAPHFKDVYPWVKAIIENETTLISDLARISIEATINYLELNTILLPSSSVYNNAQMSGQNRVLDICKREGASHYINALGGKSLYDKKVFSKNDIELNFIVPVIASYRQNSAEFTPMLSILDVMMFLPKEQVKHMLSKYHLE